MVKEIIYKINFGGGQNPKIAGHCNTTIKKDQPYIEVDYILEKGLITEDEEDPKIEPKIFQIKPEDFGIQPIDKIFEELDKIDYPKEEREYNININGKSIKPKDKKPWHLYVDGVHLKGYDKNADVYAKFIELINYNKIYDYVKQEFKKLYP